MNGDQADTHGVGDIYFPERSITKQSREHVLLNGLGGRWEAKGLIDETTNSLLGNTIDAALQKGLLAFRTLLGAENGRGEAPPALLGCQGADGHRYDLKAGGQPQAHPRVTFIDGGDGTRQVHGFFRSLAEGRKHLRGMIKKHGLPPETLDSATFVEHEVPAPSLRVSVDLTKDSRRAIAKMACNLFATAHRDLFLSQAFDRVRGFVTMGVGDLVAVSSEAEHGQKMGSFDHLILVTGSSATGKVDALVTLYGHLHFVVQLANTANLPTDVRLSYRVDPLGREDRRNAEEDSRLDVPSFVLDDGPQGQVWLNANKELLAATYRFMSFMRKFERAWQRAHGHRSVGDEITERDRGVLIMALMAEIFPELSQVLLRPDLDGVGAA